MRSLPWTKIAAQRIGLRSRHSCARPVVHSAVDSQRHCAGLVDAVVGLGVAAVAGSALASVSNRALSPDSRPSLPLVHCDSRPFRPLDAQVHYRK